ncbi:hypothetical protein DC007_14655, partial [Enterococcus faecalis]
YRVKAEVKAPARMECGQGKSEQLRLLSLSIYTRALSYWGWGGCYDASHRSGAPVQQVASDWSCPGTLIGQAPEPSLTYICGHCPLGCMTHVPTKTITQ